MTGLTGQYASVADTRLYYETAGDPSAQPVLLVHTAGSDSRQWRYVAPALADRDFYPVVPDLPGHGKSYPSNWEVNSTIREHAAAVWALAEHLDLSHPVVSGCSVGGDVTLDLAVTHGDDLACAVAFEGAARTRGAATGRLAHPHACPGWQNVLDYSVVDSTGEPCPEERRTELRWQHRGSQEVATNDLQAWADFDVRDQLDEANCPVLVVRGEADFYIQDDVFAETVEGLPDGEGVELEDTGHYPMMERPERTTELIADFVAENH